MSAEESIEFEIQIIESNNSSEFVVNMGNTINFVTLPRKMPMPLQPETIAIYTAFLVILETVGNFLLFCIIVYEKYGMDTQKRTLTNQLLSMMILVQIFFNIFIMPVYAIYHIFGLHSKYLYRVTKSSNLAPKIFELLAWIKKCHFEQFFIKGWDGRALLKENL